MNDHDDNRAPLRPDDDLDVLLRRHALTPPAGFSERVMAAVALERDSEAARPPLQAAHPALRILRALLLTGGGLLGFAQTLASLFSMWSVTLAH